MKLKSHTPKSNWGDWRESNPRPSGPQSDALTSWATIAILHPPYIAKSSTFSSDFSIFYLKPLPIDLVTLLYITLTQNQIKKTNGSKFHKKNTVVCITDRLHSITLGLSIWKRWEPPSYRDWYNKYSITIANTSLSPTIQTEVQNPDYWSLLFDIRTQYWNPMVWNSRWASIYTPLWSCNRWNE